MKYHPHQIYHIYNQGNNKQKIFFQARNYQFFLRKMRIHLSPLVDILCYCLMPNHFHWLVYTKPEACFLSPGIKPRRKVAQVKPKGQKAERESLVFSEDYQQLLSHAIGNMLSSYTRAANQQEGRTGSLFRKGTKSKNGWIDDFISLEGKNQNLFFRNDNDYGRQCFQYIHDNPVKAGLASVPEAWPYSSARDYAGRRKKSLVNQNLGRALLGVG